MIPPYAATAPKSVNELSMVNNKIIRSRQHMVSVHQALGYRGDAGSITTAIMLLNTPKATVAA